MANFDDSNHDSFDGSPPTILMPYQEWIEAAYREVAINAVKYAEQFGLPGNHNIYLTFVTAYPGVSIPARLKTQFPDKMTIVLQHQFWDLTIDDEHKRISVGLSFGGVVSTLVIPFGSITAFSDPEAKLMLTFATLPASVAPVDVSTLSQDSDDDIINQPSEKKHEDAAVISLDAFRKKHE